MKKQAAEPESWRLSPPRGGVLRVAVVYPNRYEVGMANLGFQACLEQLCGWPVTLDRAFISHEDGPPPRSLDLDLSLSSFHALFFSVSFEPDYVGLVQCLRRQGLELLAGRRSPRDPLIIAGGIAVTLNPEPVAPFCDLIGVGEAEALLPGMLRLLLEEPGRDDLLKQAARLPGWYWPLGGDPAESEVQISRQHVATLDRPCMPVVLARSQTRKQARSGGSNAFASHVDLEVSRGCRWRCRFCASGQVVTPYRELEPSQLRESLEWAVGLRGRVGLVGTDVSDHSHLRDIAEQVWSMGGELALPSLRVETLARPGSQASWLLKQRPPRTLTVAVEAASATLRCGLNKKLSRDQLLRMAAYAREAGVSQLKVYLLVAVPGEEWEEVEAIADLCQELLEVGPGGQMTLSVNGLVPKAGTPLQWQAAPELKYLRACRRLLRKRVRGDRVRLSFESPDWTRWQALLGLGGREISRHLLLAADQGWRKALAAASREEPLLQGEARRREDTLPWHFVRHGQKEDVLWREWERCLERKYTPPARLTGGDE